MLQHKAAPFVGSVPSEKRLACARPAGCFARQAYQQALLHMLKPRHSWSTNLQAPIASRLVAASSSQGDRLPIAATSPLHQAKFVPAYGVLTVLFASLGALFTLRPEWVVVQGFKAVAPSPATLCHVGLFSVFCITAAGCLACLGSAAGSCRLSDDALKRLNLGVMYSCAIAMVLQLKAVSLKVSNPAMAGAFLAVCLPTILTTATGYRASNAGVLHIPTILKSFFVGAVDAFKPRSGRGALYSAALAPLALAWPLMTFTDLHPLVQGALDGVSVYTKRTAGCGLLLLLVVLYTLKEGAEQRRLGSSPHRTLHLTLAAAFGVAGYWLLRLSRLPCTHPVLGKAALAYTGALVVLCDCQFLAAKSEAAGGGEEGLRLW